MASAACGARRANRSRSPRIIISLRAVAFMAAAVVCLVASPSAALAGPTWDGSGGANTTWSTAANWNLDAAPDLSNGTSAIVFSTLGSGTVAAATQLGGGLVDILSLQSNVVTGTTVSIGSSGTSVQGLSINSGTLVVRSGSITKANTAAVVINSTLRLQSDGFFSSTNSSNTGLLIAGSIIEDGTSRNVVINASSGRVALGGISTYTGSTTLERGTLLVGLTPSSATANAGVSAAPGVAGALGNATSEVLVGNANTAANNWNVELEIGNNVSMSRSIRFANAGTGTATLLTRGTAALRSGAIALDRVITWDQQSPAGSWTGLITGTGGFVKIGGVGLRLTNTANTFSGPVSLRENNLQFDVSGTSSALGTGASAIQMDAAGTASTRIITAFGSGTLARGFDVVAFAANPVTINTGDAGDVAFAGAMTLNSLGAAVSLNAFSGGTSRFTGVISGAAPVISTGGANTSGNKVLLSNPANSFTGQIRVGAAGLFVGANAPAGSPGALGNATSAIVVADGTSGSSPSYLVTDGPFTVGRNILIAGPADGATDAYSGQVLIGGATADASVFSGSITINRTNGIGTNNLFATTGGSVVFSGAISGTAALVIGGGASPRAGLLDRASRTGDVILSGNNSGFSGNLSLTTLARLVVASNTALGTGTGTIALYDSTANSAGTGGISTRGAVTVGRSFLLDGNGISQANRAVSFEGTTADASVFTGSITITRTSGQDNIFSAVAGGSVDFQGAITATSTNGTPMNITKNGAGLVIFSAQNNYQGSTTVNAGVLRGTDGAGISGSNVLLAGGVWESAAAITRPLGSGTGEVRLSNANSGLSGFSSANPAGMTLALGGTAAPAALTFGVTNFNMSSLVLNAPTATGPLLLMNPISLNAGVRTVSVGAQTATMAGVLSGIGAGLTKAGAGTLVLSASNSYTGATTINTGRLEIAPAGWINASSGVTINGASAELRYNAAVPLAKAITFTQGTISGTGTIGTAVTVAANTVISPGNSPGTQSYTSLHAWAPEGSYAWEINALTGTPGSTWDLVNVTSGTFDLSALFAAPGGRFTLDLITLDTLNAAGPLASPYDGGSYTFAIASYAPTDFLLPTGFTNTAGTDLTSFFQINLAGWQGEKPQLADISVKINSTATGLDLVIVPEPAAWALAAVGIAGAVLARRRRRSALRTPVPPARRVAAFEKSL